MIIPAFLTSIIAYVNHTVKPMLMVAIRRLLRGKRLKEYTRKIEFSVESGYFNMNKHNRDKRNNILQKALTMYIGETSGASGYMNANISLLAAKEKGHREAGMWEMQYGSTADQLKMYNVTTLPPKDEWVIVADGVKFREVVDNEEEEDGAEGNKTKLSKKTTLFMFSSSSEDGAERIDRYIKEAFDWYTREVGKTVDHSRYMYMAMQKEQSLSSESNGEENERSYKRYKLSDRKTFTSLFFKEKENLLHLFDNFLHKRGKYAIDGYPDKLGLLLFGPPGTGKTSLIKAVAAYTSRSIINISLSKIKTNQELMDIFFDLRYSVKGEELPVKLTFSDVIFVLEDVDAASKIVNKRSSGRCTNPKKSTTFTTKVISPRATNELTEANKNDFVMEPPALVREVSRTRTVVEESKVVQTEAESDGEEGDEAEDVAMFKAIATALGTEVDGSDTTLIGPKTNLSSKDKLDLAGLLNVLDGVVDTPDRIVIMTSNHPEKLDPALIRPGRIDKKIYLGYIDYESAVQMTLHYFSLDELNDEHKGMIETVFEREKGITPAMFEQYCAEFDDIGDFCKNLGSFFKK